MTIHEVSDLLADMVLVLWRLPDVPVSDLLGQPPETNAEKLLGPIHTSMTRRAR